jgi:hypothetical protein
MSQHEQYYHQLVAFGHKLLGEYDIDRAKRYLDMARAWRTRQSLVVNTDEEQRLEREWRQTDAEYPVPEGLKRREGCPGCGNNKCRVCYEEVVSEADPFVVGFARKT